MRGDAQAKNEELFRSVNEQIEAVSQTLALDDETMEFLCECDQQDCYERVNATRAEYESVRSDPTHFIVLPGHVDERVEQVAFASEGFWVVEKEGTAAWDAEEDDSRSP
jgi:hypothetical protein